MYKCIRLHGGRGGNKLLYLITIFNLGLYLVFFIEKKEKYVVSPRKAFIVHGFKTKLSIH